MLTGIKKTLMEFHQGQGFILFDSFPLIANDPTVLFVNATITPFKSLFCEATAVPHSYALIQQCFRVGKEAGILGASYSNPNQSLLFEMFGSGFFNCTHVEAVSYLLEILMNLGLSKDKFRFTVPKDSLFNEALRENGINKEAFYEIDANGDFWQEWRFGKDGMVGNGITVIYAQEGCFPDSIKQLHNEKDGFIELGNLIYIHGMAQNDKVIPIINKGFEVGLGIGRLANVLHDVAPYQVFPLDVLVAQVSKYFKVMGENYDMAFARAVTDHLRVATLLIEEGLVPGNKEHSFVLRKLIRDLLEIVWVATGQVFSIKDLVVCFLKVLMPNNGEIVKRVIIAEENAFLDTLRKGKKFLKKATLSNQEILRNTYGIRQSLIPLLEKV